MVLVYYCDLHLRTAILSFNVFFYPFFRTQKKQTHLSSFNVSNENNETDKILSIGKNEI